MTELHGRRIVGMVMAAVMAAVLAPPALAGPQRGAPPAVGAAPASAALRPDRLGPWDVGRTTFTMTDSSRDDRSFSVDVWYPVDEADADGPRSSYDLLPGVGIPSQVATADPPVADVGNFPLVAFSHGSGGVRFQSWFLTEALASHGFVVVAPDHTGNTAYDQIGGSSDPIDVIARNRPGDISFVISEMLARDQRASSRFNGAIDASRIGVSGHSFGGFTTLAMASGYESVPVDPRVDAIAPLAPASGLLDDARLRSITIPTLIVGGTRDTTTPIVDNSTRPFDEVSSSALFRVDVRNAAHASFTNICAIIERLQATDLPPALIAGVVAIGEGSCGPGDLPPPRAFGLTNRYTVAFMLRYVAGDGRYARYLRPINGRWGRPDPVVFFRGSGA